MIPDERVEHPGRAGRREVQLGGPGSERFMPRLTLASAPFVPASTRDEGRNHRAAVVAINDRFDFPVPGPALVVGNNFGKHSERNARTIQIRSSEGAAIES